MSTTEAVTFWDGVYATRPAGDPTPNDRLVETVADSTERSGPRGLRAGRTAAPPR